jgi:NAD-dependent deacetylase
MNAPDDMPKPPLDTNKVVVFSGAGLSAPSGLSTFRDANGLWERYRLEDVATPEAWARQPELVLEFYNERRAKAAAAKPNAGHIAIADLEQRFRVVVVTQNVDDLHERAGSTEVIHLHGELRKARSTANPALICEIGAAPIQLGDRCAEGSQLRPHIVWFGEEIMNHAEALAHLVTAGRVLAVGTSLTVYPAAGLLKHARYQAMRLLVDLEAPTQRFGFKSIQGSADAILPRLVEKWLQEDFRETN